MRRKISLLILIAFVTALAAINHGCSGTNDANTEIGDGSLLFDINDPKIKERLAEDDGYAFAVLYGADIHGSLETCG